MDLHSSIRGFLGPRDNSPPGEDAGKLLLDLLKDPFQGTVSLLLSSVRIQRPVF